MATGLRTFEDERDRLNRILARMGGLVEQAMADALTALSRRDAELAAEVMQRDSGIDSYEDEINEHVVRLLAVHRPVAADLRWMVAVLKIAGRLERIGDQAAGIAERVIAVNDLPTLPLPRGIDRMARLAQGMVKQTLDALPTLDDELAWAARARDRDLDQLHGSVMAEVVALVNGDPQAAPGVMQFLFIARAIARIGDHCAVVAATIARAAGGAARVEAGPAPPVAPGV